jgi:hypothetical protein
VDEKRNVWCCNVDEMMWEKSKMEGRKADGQKLRRAKKTKFCEMEEASSIRISASVC